MSACGDLSALKKSKALLLAFSIFSTILMIRYLSTSNATTLMIRYLSTSNATTLMIGYLSTSKVATTRTTGNELCTKLFHGEKNLVVDSRRIYIRTAADIAMDTNNCHSYAHNHGYINEPVNEFEANFELAFSILMFTEPAQFEKLFLAVYRPQNYYCIHVDKKSSKEVLESVKNIIRCFKNTFLLAPAISVKWGNYSVLEPEIKCMEKLLTYKRWKYFINLTGQEYPIRTNYELVQILNAYNNSNDIEGITMRTNPRRWANVPSAPHNIQPMKGAVHVLATRAFVDFLLHDKRAMDFHEWTKSTRHPDETLFTSINFNQHLRAPGGYNGNGLPDEQSYNVRKKNWEGKARCKGKWVRSVCVFGVDDLPELYAAKEPFVNKLHFHFQPMALDCMEEWYFTRTDLEYKGILNFNVSYYKSLSFVNNHFVS